MIYTFDVLDVMDSIKREMEDANIYKEICEQQT